jgi:hypothetical protein
MDLQTKIDRQWEQLAADADFGGQTRCLEFEVDHGRVVGEVLEINSLSCALRELKLQTDALAGASADDLRRLGDSLSSRLQYLLEPISTLELDRDGFTLQLRSNPPQQDDDARSYYELMVRRNSGIQLCRYRKHPGQPRQRIPLSLTREVFSRLVHDFDAAVA